MMRLVAAWLDINGIVLCLLLRRGDVIVGARLAGFTQGFVDGFTLTSMVLAPVCGVLCLAAWIFLGHVAFVLFVPICTVATRHFPAALRAWLLMWRGQR